VWQPPPPRGGAVGPLLGAVCLYEGHIYFGQNMGARKKQSVSGGVYGDFHMISEI
jgi:hypothetical protein